LDFIRVSNSNQYRSYTIAPNRQQVKSNHRKYFHWSMAMAAMMPMKTLIISYLQITMLAENIFPAGH
jgi:hypothetical protein